MGARDERFDRTELLLGDGSIERLSATRVAIFGVGGVGGYVLEGLIRSGIEQIDIIDSDTVSVSNINRQIIATDKTVGRLKVEVAAERASEINPKAKITAIPKFYSKESAGEFDLSKYNYIVDAIDTVSAKIELIVNATSLGIPIISSMGAGGKLDPTAFEVSDLYKTSVCPLARVMRTELKKRGVKGLKVVYSKEEPIKRVVNDGTPRHAPGSISFVPSVVGLIIAGEVIKDIINANNY
ncbi:MAG: tRNA threonylcarbamoyladenosine dehydratase [Clostridia bacterium]|nr:tRNA threonylcarbamoyladenosine dehydratase [Clostridia bacterium]